MFSAREALTSLKWLLRSSTLRLTLVLSAVFATGLAFAVFVALTLGSDALERRIDATLEATAGTTSLDGERGDGFGLILRSLDDISDLPRPFFRAIERGGGTVVLANDYRQAETWRVLVASDQDDDPIVLAVPLDDSGDALELLAGILWITVLATAAIILAIGLGAGILSQRRLRRINETLGALGAGDLTARTGLTRSKDDLDDMARQLDSTAAELERLVSQTRHLSASLAHDLRTPLARLRSRLDVLPDSDERGAAIEEANKLSGIFDTIMRVARIEAAQGQDGFEPVELGPFVEDLAETFGPVAEDSGKTMQITLTDPDTVRADRQMLVQAMANLIQNALRHGGPDITLTASGRSIGVADNGPGVEPADYPEIVKPMVRLDAARNTEGTGLGLALVRAVADRHGAALQITPNSTAAPHGLAVKLKFADL